MIVAHADQAGHFRFRINNQLNNYYYWPIGHLISKLQIHLGKSSKVLEYFKLEAQNSHRELARCIEYIVLIEQ